MYHLTATRKSVRLLTGTELSLVPMPENGKDVTSALE